MPPPAPILALFNHPAMLFWAAAAAAPLIIHLLNRRRYREVRWAAMEYLLAAMRKNVRRVRIEQWLLLALRTLLILLLVAAVAEPVLQGVGLRPMAGARTHKLFILDASYSMSYKAAEASNFARAKELIAEIVDQSSQGDGFTLVLMAAPSRIVIGTPAFSRTEFLEELEGVQLPHAGGDLSGAFAKAHEVLRTARRDERKLTREEVYVLSDLGRTSWTPRDRAATATVRQQAEQFANDGAALVVVDLGDDDLENVAITELTSREPVAACHRETAFETQVRNFGRASRQRQLVAFYVDGVRAGEERVDLPAGGSATASFSYRFDAPGDHVIEARFAGDKLGIDNHRWLSMPTKEHLRVLCVDGYPAANEEVGATDYLRVALAPKSNAGAAPLVQVVVATEGTWLDEDLSRFDCVVLSDVPLFTAAEARALKVYLDGGGGLLTFLGPHVSAENYNARLGGTGSNLPRLLPAELGEVVSDARSIIDVLNYQHSIVSPFRGQERAGLLTTPIAKYVRLAPRADGAAKVAARVGGDPLIVEEPIGRGVSILVATSAADREWTMWPMWPSFVPIVQEMLAFSIRGQVEDRNVQVGQSIGGSLRNANDTSVTVRLPSGEETLLAVESTEGAAHWSFAETSQSGVYRAQVGGAAGSQLLFSANVDTAESDLTRVTPDELRGELFAGLPVQVLSQWRQSDAVMAGSLGRPAAWHRGLLVAALGLMFLESTLAWIFGARSA